MVITAKVTRDFFEKNCTIGSWTLFKDGQIWQHCFTCEDVVRGDGDPKTVKDWKIAGNSAIPYGDYLCKFTWSNRFGKNKWEISSVPGFSGVRIHAGNTDKDTEGCLLLGNKVSPNYSGIEKSAEAIAIFESLLNSVGNPSFILTITK